MNAAIDYDQQRRNTLNFGTACDLTEGSALENAPIEELNEALEQRAQRGDRVAWKAVRRELRTRQSEGGCPFKLPRTIEEHQATFAERAAEIEREHYTYEHASVVGKHLMRRNGYRPRDPASSTVSASPMPPSKSHTSALAVLSDRQICATVQISKLQSVALQQLAMVKGLERDAALRAILVGLTLHRIKASLKHGEFMPWIKSKTQGAAYRQCNYYMRLAAVFVEKTRVTRPEILALPGDQTDLALEPADATARRMMDKATKFVGDRSLNELLDEHRIKDAKKLGGRRDAAAGAGAKIDPERLAEMKREEASEWLARAQQLFVDENIFQHLKPDERRTVVESLEAITAKARAALKDSAT